MYNNEFEPEKGKSDGSKKEKDQVGGQEIFLQVPAGKQNGKDVFDPLRFLPPELLPQIPNRPEAPGAANGRPAGGQPGGDHRGRLPQEAKLLEIPTLHLGKPADENDCTKYPTDSKLAKIYSNAKDGIVQIYGYYNRVENGKIVPHATSASGFFVTEDGRIATAYHVVEGKSSLTVKTTDGKLYGAIVEKIEPFSDLAIIKIEGGAEQKFKALPLADKPAQTGEMVIGLGHPNAWEKVYLSPGQVDEVSKGSHLVLPLFDPSKLTFWTYIRSRQNMISGSSGGPLLSEHGTVVGVFSSSYDEDGKQESESAGVDRIHRLLNGGHEEAIIGPSIAHTGLHAVNEFNRFMSWRSGKPGQCGPVLSIGLGTADLVSKDLGALSRAVRNGSGGDILNSSIQVGADLILIGGGVAGFGSRYRRAASLLPLSGSAIKLATDSFGYYKIIQGIRSCS
jgi:hypothetical protein